MSWLKRLLSFALAMARELSDERAYARYLEHTGRAASAAEWKVFTERRYRAKYQNAKCC
jgi:hypothetical protein